jgi:diacylglycerol kinase (ATP)
MTATVFVIVNPAAGRGRSLQRLGAFNACMVEERIAGTYYTRERGDEERLAGLAIENGADVLVAVGGDGTCSGVANAILRAQRRCRLAVIASGTGNDFAKTIGVENQAPEQIAALITSGVSSEIDVGRAEGRHFLNSCGFGFDASVLEATQRVRFWKGNGVYIYSALRQLLTYRSVGISVNSENADVLEMLMVTVSNGRSLGGAFRIAPNASVLDGELDVGFFADTGVIGRVRIFAAALRGTHIGLPSVKTALVRSLTLHFSDPPMMEVDGELRRARSSIVNIECLPRVLSVIAAPGYPR